VSRPDRLPRRKQTTCGFRISLENHSSSLSKLKLWVQTP
jgi:hypothetical protein